MYAKEFAHQGIYKVTTENKPRKFSRLQDIFSAASLRIFVFLFSI